MRRADEGELRLLANESVHFNGVRWGDKWAFRLREERRQIERERQIQAVAA